MTIKLMQLMSGGAVGGAEGFFERLAIAFENHHGIDQRVIIRGFNDRVERLREGGITPKTLPFGGPIDCYTPFMLKRYFAIDKPDIVMTWMSRATAKCPRGNYKLVARLGGYYPLKYYKHCDYLIGNTPDIVRYLAEEGFPKERLMYLPNFVEEKKGELLMRHTFDTPEDAPLFLGLGRLHENKGFDILIKAAAKVKDAYVWIAGEGPLEEELKALAKKHKVLKRVKFLGWRRDAHNLLRTADVLVCSSRHEPLGNIVLEAFAQKTPVIAGASQGPSALIQHGELGLLYNPENADDLAAHMKSFVTDRKAFQTMAENAYLSYYMQFSKEKVLERYMDFFQRILR